MLARSQQVSVLGAGYRTSYRSVFWVQGTEHPIFSRSVGVLQKEPQNPAREKVLLINLAS